MEWPFLLQRAKFRLKENFFIFKIKSELILILGMFSTRKNEELIGIIRFVYLVKECSQKYRSSNDRPTLV
jgi:hypothetical protein